MHAAHEVFIVHIYTVMSLACCAGPGAVMSVPTFRLTNMSPCSAEPCNVCAYIQTNQHEPMFRSPVMCVLTFRLTNMSPCSEQSCNVCAYIQTNQHEPMFRAEL